MTRALPRTAALAVVLLAAALGAGADIRVEPEVPAVAPEESAAPRAKAGATRVRNIRLEAPGVEKSTMPARRAGVALQVGFARRVPALGDAFAAATQLEWLPQETGGYRAAVSVTSPGAAAIRLGLRIDALPAGAVLRFYAPGAEPVFEATAAQIALTSTWWSPLVEGDTIAMEVDIPARSSPSSVILSSPTLSHLVTGAARNFAMSKAASSCTLDASCYQQAWATQSAATARMVFTRGGATFLCTGTLLADEDTTTTIPYFLTANHCISNQEDASSLVTYWFLRASECGSATPGPYRSTQGGATLLHATGVTDTSFLRLNGVPPPGAAYAGWFVGNPVPSGAGATAIHHAKGDLQKISFGSITGYARCDPPESSGRFECFGADAVSGKFLYARWGADGITEGGSSGSGLFLNEGRYLVGQLYGGDATCADPATDIYGRFDVAYRDSLYQWLSASPPATTPNAPAFDYSDLWWNSMESGWGVSITQHASRQIFATWYAYGADGQPLWVVMSGGQWTSPTTFTGDLYTTTGPDPTGPFDPARVVVRRVGSGTFVFDTRGAGSLAYTVDGVLGSRPITRQPFGAPDSTITANFNDLWWNPQESGWGVSINQQNRTLFAVWYAYGADNKPVWYVMSGGTWTSLETYTGTLYRTSRPPSPYFGNAPFDPAAVSVTPVGSLTFTFQGANFATMAYTINGIRGTKSITRQSF